MKKIFVLSVGRSDYDRYYPIINGIPIMVPDNQRNLIYESNFLSKWTNKIPEKIKSNSMPFNINQIHSELS